MKYPNLITHTDRAWYWPDLIVFRNYGFLGSAKSLKFLNWNKDNQGNHVAFSNMGDATIVITKAGQNSRFLVTFHYNFQRSARHCIQRKLEISELNPLAFEHDTNFIPIELREAMVKAGLEPKVIRTIIERRAWRANNKFKRRLKEHLQKALLWNSNWDARINTSLAEVQIAHDVCSAPGEEIALDPAVRRAFNKGTNWKAREYNGDGTSRLIEDGPFARSSEGGGVDKRPYLFAECLDGSEKMIYIKASDEKRGALNRIERRYVGRKIIRRAASRRNTIHGLSDFRDLIRRLTKRTVDDDIAAFSCPKDVSEEARKDLLLRWCNGLFPAKSGLTAFSLLWETGYIRTGKESERAHRSISRAASTLARQGKLLVRVRRGLYRVDWVWVLGNKAAHRVRREPTK